MYRTHNCNELREKDCGKQVKLAGWLASKRDKGSIMFAVIRDFYGVTQIVTENEDMLNTLRAIPTESTIAVEGMVVLRSAPNDKLDTGKIEIKPTKIEVLGKRYMQSLPFEPENSGNANEEDKLKYRFLDLRNKDVRSKIEMRSKIIFDLRKAMIDKGFLEIQTPILTSSSPEGARDYIVPSRVHPGKFYALPQAPQQYKQLLMCSGFDKYFQIAPCFRDEDARADRSPGEFYQLDMEMAFAEQEDVFKVIEDVLPPIFKKYSSWKVDETPFLKIAYRDALELYGTDKPDLRNPLLIKDVTDIMKKYNVALLENKFCKMIVVDNFNQSRKVIDGIINEFKEKVENNDGAFWFKVDNENCLVGGISKFFDNNSENVINELNLKPNTLVFIVADNKNANAQKKAGVLRNIAGKNLDLFEKDVFKFCWIVDFPMYEIGEESGKLEFCHNPFSMPKGGMNALLNSDPLDILANQYDIICNGVELSSGAVRNHDPEIMKKAFEIVGIGEKEIEEKFSALYTAFKFGAPPHAGVAPGIDRMVMLICNTPNIREVIAYPMNKNAQDLMMNAPSVVTKQQLDDVHIMIKPQNKDIN